MCDVDGPSAYRARFVLARLPHRCESCPYPIMPGEEYHLATGVWDGQGRTYRRHQLCAVLEDQVGEDGCALFGDLRNMEGLQCRSWVFQRAWGAIMGRPGESEKEAE